MTDVNSLKENLSRGPVFLAPPFKHERTTLERLEKFISKQYFLDHNLRGRLYEEESNLEFNHVNFGQKRVSFEEAMAAFVNLETKDAKVKNGYIFGPAWATEWFCLEFQIPHEWSGKRVNLIWDSECEALLWSSDGTPLIGLSSEVNRTDFCLTGRAESSHLPPNKFRFYVEAAANTPFGAGKTDCISPPDPEKRFTIKAAKIAIFRNDIYNLLIDLEVLIAIVKNLQAGDHKKYETLYFANNLVNNFIIDSSQESVLNLHNSVLRYLNANSIESSHFGKITDRNFTIHAIGNCHIDTAWLWPYDETKRKCARSWATTVSLMEEYPGLIFACSQAQQMQWVKENYPKLFEKIVEKAKAGRFVLVGGCWVEMDGNLPGGESFARQMLYGQKFFLDNFGRRCTEFWLPDTFGYCAQLPQLMLQAGMKRFLTQKMSWNLVNKFPHSTFWWRGIDGSRVLTHFPPADTYCCRLNADELTKTVSNFSDKGRSKHAVILYGHGDGGGGPDKDMLERLGRFSNAFESISVRPSTPANFFESVERSELPNLCTWDGELYLELHNGTYTTHADMKKGNRTCEFLLRDCEFAALIDCFSLAAKENKKIGPFSHKNWADEWKKVLLNQFHDVLPGSSIGLVYEDARKIHAQVLETCRNYLKSAPDQSGMETENDQFLLNSLPWPRTILFNNDLYEVPGMSIFNKNRCKISPKTIQTQKLVTINESGGSFTLKNEYLAATIDKNGHLASLRLNNDQKNVDPAFDFIDQNSKLGNALVIFDDVPLYWDAWDVMDYHVETRHVISDCLEAPKIVQNSSYHVAIEFSKRISSNSTLKQTISLTYGQPYLTFLTKIDWHESHKMLKVEFPVNVRSTTATYDVQFGHIQRPNHRNTSWDAAKFEVCAHKWADLSEFGRGLALLNDSKYGYSCYDNVLTLSLLRSPKSPDAEADMGQHEFTYAVMPHSGPLQTPSNSPFNVIQCSYELNDPVKLCTTRNHWSNSNWIDKSLFRTSNKAVMIESVKISENENGIILRLFESYGSTAETSLSFGFSVKHANICNLLEDLGQRIDVRKDADSDGGFSCINLIFKPFQVLSVFIVVDL